MPVRLAPSKSTESADLQLGHSSLPALSAALVDFIVPVMPLLSAYRFRIQSLIVRVVQTSQAIAAIRNSDVGIAEKLHLCMLLWIPLTRRSVDKLISCLSRALAPRDLLAKKFFLYRIARSVERRRDFDWIRLAVRHAVDNTDEAFVYRPVLTNMIASDIRKEAAEISAQVKNERFPYVGKTESSMPTTLVDGRMLRLGSMLTEQQIQDVHAYLRTRKVKGAHYFAYGLGEQTLEDCERSGAQYASYSRETILNCPHILPALLDDGLIEPISEYIGTVPTLSIINLFWTFPREEAGNVSHFHRDVNDLKSVSVFIYLTDIERMEDGAHQYIPRSADVRWVQDRLKRRGIPASLFNQARPPSGYIESVFDPDEYDLMSDSRDRRSATTTTACTEESCPARNPDLFSMACTVHLRSNFKTPTRSCHSLTFFGDRVGTRHTEAFSALTSTTFKFRNPAWHGLTHWSGGIAIPSTRLGSARLCESMKFQKSEYSDTEAA